MRLPLLLPLRPLRLRLRFRVLRLLQQLQLSQQRDSANTSARLRQAKQIRHLNCEHVRQVRQVRQFKSDENKNTLVVWDGELDRESVSDRHYSCKMLKITGLGVDIFDKSDMLDR